MDITWQWAGVVAEQEGDILEAALIEGMMDYVQSFAARQQLYQKIQARELPWIQQVLAQHQLQTDGELSPQSRWAAEFLARHVRALALSMLVNQPEPLLQELQWGEIETSLDLQALLADLVAVMQRDCSELEQRLLQPFWDLLERPAPPPEIPETTGAVPTLMEMFV
ncbi:MAG: hypothetical protein Q6K99_05165 [Thermostichales cyanobacterium BF4_bins_65]